MSADGHSVRVCLRLVFEPKREPPEHKEGTPRTKDSPMCIYIYIWYPHPQKAVKPGSMGGGGLHIYIYIYITIYPWKSPTFLGQSAIGTAAAGQQTGLVFSGRGVAVDTSPGPVKKERILVGEMATQKKKKKKTRRRVARKHRGKLMQVR